MQNSARVHASTYHTDSLDFRLSARSKADIIRWDDSDVYLGHVEGHVVSTLGV